MLNVGASFQVLPFLTTTADVRQELGDGMRLGERTHVGAGAELRLIPFLPLRAGLAAMWAEGQLPKPRIGSGGGQPSRSAG